MRIIRKRILMVEAAICIWALITICFLQKVSLNNTHVVIFLIFESLAILLLFLLVNQCRIYEDAKLVVENTIIKILSVDFKENCDENIEILISCFGILIDSKVIKYNVGNINLISFEINGDYICISYGSKKKIQKTCILHGFISHEEKMKISKQLHYETGILPVIK